MTDNIDPVGLILHRSEIALLQKEPLIVDVERVLRRVGAESHDLDPLSRERLRTEVDSALGQLGVANGRRLVAAAFAPNGNGNGEHKKNPDLQGQGVTLADPEPWPDPVDGAEVLDELARTFARYVALPENGAVALALWTLHAHAHPAAAVSPLLALTSPERRCGKSTALHLLSALVPRPLPVSSISPAALFRAVERYRPSLLLDEADTVLRDNEDLRCMLNASHARAGAVVIRTVGDDFEPRAFSTWCPKAVALIGELPGTLADRAITLHMRRRRADERVDRLRLDRLHELEPLRRQAWRWAQDHVPGLRQADPSVPEGLHDRAADNWRSLLAIADACGDLCALAARVAASSLSGTSGNQEAPAVQLLADVRELFRGVDRLGSAEVIEALVQREDRPWPEWHQGKPLSKRGLARLLGRFGVAPKKIRLGAVTVQGYQVEQFADVFARYLPPQVEHPEQASNDATISGFDNRNGRTAVPVTEMPEKPHGASTVPDVPLAEGGYEQGDVWEPEA